MLTNSFWNPLDSQHGLNDAPINVHLFNTANTHLINQVITDTFHMPWRAEIMELLTISSMCVREYAYEIEI